jgi:5'-deoxynucleotidase YfbR-like HD superfamily hydrolase
MMEIKAENPAGLLQDKEYAPQMAAFFELCHLKQLYRQGWLRRGVPRERCESIAEHSFGVAVLALWLAPAQPELDVDKVVRMALLHDLGEVYAGDIIPGDGVSEGEKHQREAEAVRKILSQLPDGQGNIQLWDEFEEGISPEARFVHQIDRLEMGLQAAVYARQGLIEGDEFFDSARQAMVEPRLSKLLEEIQSAAQQS